jgi:hypothetical protein
VLLISDYVPRRLISDYVRLPLVIRENVRPPKWAVPAAPRTQHLGSPLQTPGSAGQRSAEGPHRHGYRSH